MVESWNPICSFLATNGYKGCQNCLLSTFLVVAQVKNMMKWPIYLCLQSRLSPFANTKGRGEKKKQKQEEEEEKKPKETCSEPNNRKMKNLTKWFSLIDATTFSKNKLPAKKLQSSLYLNQQLHKTLYGFIVFEVEWANVRGINYVNELLVLLATLHCFCLTLYAFIDSYLIDFFIYLDRHISSFRS